MNLHPTGAPLPPGQRRRGLLRHGLIAAVAACLPLAASQALAQPAPISTPALGVFSLLGDSFQVTEADQPTDTRLDRNQRMSLDLKDLGLDQVALGAVRSTMATLQPSAKVSIYRANAPIPLAEQRLIADGARRAELPEWIISTINRNNLSHVLLITRGRGPANMRTADGHGLGRGMVEGIGFYIDPVYDVQNQQTGIISRGLFASYIDIRMTLMDARSGDLVRQMDVRYGQTHGATSHEQTADPWEVLEPRRKVEVLRELVEVNVSRVLPLMFQPR